LKPILEIKNVSKKFRINAVSQPYLSLRETVFNIFKPGKRKEEFWALQEVSFNVNPGETIGIIGKNGAGKSTLLKVLSRITPPTSGSVTYRGRIASLLEVGTGFHPELSGRENVYLNGSIMGMRRAEVTRQFDAIVDFSGVEKFIDTPLKNYSSGMQLRLAFAVAAFLEPEILVIDEVLAVGDAEFQNKCIGKMNDVSRSGRTILFVSHNMGILETLCKESILLDHGRVLLKASTGQVVSQYISSFTSGSAAGTVRKDKAAYIKQVFFSGSNGVKSSFDSDEDINVNIVWENSTGVSVNVNIELLNTFGTRIFFSIDTMIDENGTRKSARGIYESTVVVPGGLLNIGQYVIHVGLDNAKPQVNYDAFLNSSYFSVVDESARLKKMKGAFVGVDTSQHVLHPSLNWNFKKIN
jgi:lipopolysaccharide transport system ATP-binding protein